MTRLSEVCSLLQLLLLTVASHVGHPHPLAIRHLVIAALRAHPIKPVPLLAHLTIGLLVLGRPAVPSIARPLHPVQVPTHPVPASAHVGLLAVHRLLWRLHVLLRLVLLLLGGTEAVPAEAAVLLSIARLLLLLSPIPGHCTTEVVLCSVPRPRVLQTVASLLLASAVQTVAILLVMAPTSQTCERVGGIILIKVGLLGLSWLPGGES